MRRHRLEYACASFLPCCSYLSRLPSAGGTSCVSGTVCTKYNDCAYILERVQVSLFSFYIRLFPMHPWDCYIGSRPGSYAI